MKLLTRPIDMLAKVVGMAGLMLGCWLALLSPVVAAEEGGTHLAYRVTAYSLGAFMSEDEQREFGSTGNFQPLLITGSAADILTSEHQGMVSWVEVAPHSTSSGGVALGAELNASPTLAIQGAFGLTRNLWSADTANAEGASSWEANLGVVYRLLNNISYELHFGYMDTGDLFNSKNTYTDIESIIMVSNRLTMSF